MRRGEKRGFCLKRARGRTYSTLALAIKEAKQVYDESGVKVFVYGCEVCVGYMHLTRKEPKGKWRRLNQKIYNYHTSREQFGTGKARQRRKKNAAKARKQLIPQQMPFLIWEGEGGALHPRDLVD